MTSTPWRPRLSLLSRRAYRVFRGQSMTSVLIRGGTSSFVINVVGLFVGFAVTIVLTRSLGADSYGNYTYVANWMEILIIFATLGLPSTFVRFLAGYNGTQDWQHFRGLLRRGNQIVLASSVVSVGVALAIMAVLHERLDRELVVAFLIAFAFVPVQGIGSLQSATLNALKQIAWSQLLGRLLFPAIFMAFVGVAFVVVETELAAYHVLVANLVAGLFMIAIGRFRMRRALPAPVKIAQPLYDTWNWMRVSGSLLFVQEMRLVMNRTDIVLIGAMLGTREAGIYAIATRLANLSTMGLTAGTTVTAPLVAELYAKGDHEELQRIVSLAVWGAALSSIVLTAGLVVGHQFVLGVFGQEFTEGASVMFIMLAGTLINSWTGPVGVLLNMTGHHGVNAKLIAGTALLNLVLCYPAILLWGANGAALVTALCVGIKNLATWWVVYRELGINSSIFVRPRLGRAS